MSVIGGLLFVADILEQEERGTGRLFFGSVVGIAAVAFMVWLLMGKNVQETKSNAKRFLKGLGILVLVVIVFGPLAKCMGGSSSPTDVYFRR